uniref:GOLD domain-containing protein n=1 Tax=Arion vulgaris TaxID=1028688 RepID=A0A0B6ZZG3_9EUPU
MEKLKVFAIVLLFSCCCGTELDLTVEISPGKQECFWEKFPAATSIELDYQFQDNNRR